MDSQPRWIHKYEFKPDRWIFIPTEETIKVGTEIKNAVTTKWPTPSYYFHLRQGGHVAALRHHQADKYFACLDIEKFFNSINRSRLTRSLKQLFDYKTARDYTLLSAVRHPKITPKRYVLPYGFVQSPVLASLCLRYSTLGNKIDQISRAGAQRISIYMDDIIISGNVESDLQHSMDEIKQAAVKSKFQLNSKKEQGPSTKITVFNVDMTSAYLAIEKRRYLELRCNYQSTTNQNVRHGIGTYVSTINKKQCTVLDE
jgi:hypothetical protein